MKALIWVQDALLRDQLRAGLVASPGLEVICAEGSKALRCLSKGEKNPSEAIDWIWFELESTRNEETFQAIRECNREAPFVLLGDEKACNRMGSLKEQWKISGFLKLPLDAGEFFKTLSRLRARRLAQEAKFS